MGVLLYKVIKYSTFCIEGLSAQSGNILRLLEPCQ